MLIRQWTMSDPVPTSKHGRLKAKKVGISIGIIAGMAIAGISGTTYLQSTVIAEPPMIVTVSGKVSAFFETQPVSVLFHNVRSGETENVNVTGTRYPIELPNGNYDWRVVLIWQGPSGSIGQCDAGYVTYHNTYDASITQDISC